MLIHLRKYVEENGGVPEQHFTIWAGSILAGTWAIAKMNTCLYMGLRDCGYSNEVSIDRSVLDI